MVLTARRSRSSMRQACSVDRARESTARLPRLRAGPTLRDEAGCLRRCRGRAVRLCAPEFHEFDVTKPSRVVGGCRRRRRTRSGIRTQPYEGKPNISPRRGRAADEQRARGRRTDDVRHALRRNVTSGYARCWRSIDGQILALSNPPTDLQLQTLRLQLIQLAPLLAPYPDMRSEQHELAAVVAKLPS